MSRPAGWNGSYQIGRSVYKILPKKQNVKQVYNNFFRFGRSA